MVTVRSQRVAVKRLKISTQDRTHTNADGKAHTKAHTSARPTNPPRTRCRASSRTCPAVDCGYTFYIVKGPTLQFLLNRNRRLHDATCVGGCECVSVCEQRRARALEHRQRIKKQSSAFLPYVTMSLYVSPPPRAPARAPPRTVLASLLTL